MHLVTEVTDFVLGMYGILLGNGLSKNMPFVANNRSSYVDKAKKIKKPFAPLVLVKEKKESKFALYVSKANDKLPYCRKWI
jgi:hypothetical protein